MSEIENLITQQISKMKSNHSPEFTLFLNFDEAILFDDLRDSLDSDPTITYVFFCLGDLFFLEVTNLLVTIVPFEFTPDAYILELWYSMTTLSEQVDWEKHIRALNHLRYAIRMEMQRNDIPYLPGLEYLKSLYIQMAEARTITNGRPLN